MKIGRVILTAFFVALMLMQTNQNDADAAAFNLFDPSCYTQADYLDSALVLSSGDILAKDRYENYLVTCKIPVTAGKTYTFTPAPWNYAGLAVENRGRCYTSADAACKWVAFTDNGDETYTFTAPENADCIRFSRNKMNKGFAGSIQSFEQSFVIVEGTSIPDDAGFAPDAGSTVGRAVGPALPGAPAVRQIDRQFR